MLAWSPGNPAAGNTVTFSVTIKNQGTIALGAGAHGITLTVLDANNGATVRTLTGSFTGTIAAGATTSPVNLGTWTAVNGKYTVRVVVAVDANELPVKQANNTSNTAVLRRPRREHALRHVRGRGRHRRRRRTASSARTGPSATSPVRRPAARRSR